MPDFFVGYKASFDGGRSYSVVSPKTRLIGDFENKESIGRKAIALAKENLVFIVDPSPLPNYISRDFGENFDQVISSQSLPNNLVWGRCLSNSLFICGSATEFTYNVDGNELTLFSSWDNSYTWENIGVVSDVVCPPIISADRQRVYILSKTGLYTLTENEGLVLTYPLTTGQEPRFLFLGQDGVPYYLFRIFINFDQDDYYFRNLNDQTDVYCNIRFDDVKTIFFNGKDYICIKGARNTVIKSNGPDLGYFYNVSNIGANTGSIVDFLPEYKVF